jgi:hypothetical protein
MAKWSSNYTFEESDEVASQRVEAIERVTNRLLDIAVTALPVIARASRKASTLPMIAQARRKASTPPRPTSLPVGEEGVVTHAQSCACNFCRPRPLTREDVHQLIQEQMALAGIGTQQTAAVGLVNALEKAVEAFQDPKAEPDKESGC